LKKKGNWTEGRANKGPATKGLFVPEVKHTGREATNKNPGGSAGGAHNRGGDYGGMSPKLPRNIKEKGSGW